MTALRKPVSRLLPRISIYDGGISRPLIVTLDIDGIVLRQKGSRHRLTLPYRAAWNTAALLAADERRRKRARKPAA